MDYKDKYNKLVNAIKVLQETNPSDEGIQNWVRDSVPELKGFEDERTRKEIMDFIDTKTIDSDERRNRWLSYLEKYKPISFTSLEDTKIKMSLMQYISELNQDVVHLHPGIETCNEWIAWLEKQGEQKSYGQREECVDCQFNYAGECKGSCAMKRREQNPTDKVKPKLKIEKGKWYVCIKDLLDNYSNKAFREGDIYLSTQNGSLIPSNSNVPYDVVCTDTYFRDWTIQDAKDGDVLFAENFDNIGGCVFLFKGLDSWKFDVEGDRAIATGYCCASITENGNTDFGIQGPDCVDITRVHPATKEQCDTLMKAIHNAGYEWDGDRKELKKIVWNEHIKYNPIVPSILEKKPATIDIDKMVNDYANNKERGNEEFGKPVPCMIRAYRQGLNDAIGKVVLKPTWSEEDETGWTNTMIMIKEVASNHYTKDSIKLVIDWLKFIKEKYGTRR